MMMKLHSCRPHSYSLSLILLLVLYVSFTFALEESDSEPHQEPIRIPLQRRNIAPGQHYRSSRAMVEHHARNFNGVMHAFPHEPHSNLAMFSDPAARLPLHNFYNRMYTGIVEIGTPAKPFSLVFDTGSADLWCFAAQSDKPRLDYVNYYDPSASTSSKVSTTPWSIQYGKGNAQGRLVSDTIKVVGKSAPGFTFAQATTYSTDFESPDMPLDGLLGLAFQQVNSAKSPTLMDALKSSGQIRDRVFSFYLSTDNPEGSQFILGAPDMTLSRAGNNLTYLDVTSSTGMWLLSMQGVTVNSASTPTYCRPNDCAVLLDTGTSFIGMPDAAYLDFAAKVAQVRPDCLLDSRTGLLACDKDTIVGLPSITFSIQGSSFVINPVDYFQSGVLGFMSLGSSSTSGRSNLWILGDTFLKTYYTVFDMDNRRIGIVGAKPGLPYSPPSGPNPYTSLSWQLIAIVVGSCFAGLCLILCCIRCCHAYSDQQESVPSPIYARSRSSSHSYVPPTHASQNPYLVQNAPPLHHTFHQPQHIPMAVPIQAPAPNYVGAGSTTAAPRTDFAQDFYANRV